MKIPFLSLVHIVMDRMSDEERKMLEKVKETIAKVDQAKFPYLEHPTDVIHIQMVDQKYRTLKANLLSFSRRLLLLEVIFHSFSL